MEEPPTNAEEPTACLGTGPADVTKEKDGDQVDKEEKEDKEVGGASGSGRCHRYTFQVASC